MATAKSMRSLRKRKCNPETGHRNLAKKAHNLGEEYDSVVTKKTVAASLMPAFTRNDGVRRHISDEKYVKIGWIYDKSSRIFYPPKEEKNYRINVYRNFPINIYTKEEVGNDKIHESKPWYEDFCNIPANDIFFVNGTAHIKKKALEVVSYEHGQEIVTSLLSNINIGILIFFNKKLPNVIEIKNTLKLFINCILREKEASLPKYLSDNVITTILYTGNKKQETKNIVHTLKEGCRILTKSDAKAISAYTIDGKLQHETKNGTKQIADTIKSETRKTNAGYERNKVVNTNQPSESSTSATSFDDKCSQMTKNGTKQMTDTIKSETKNDNAGCETNKVVNTNQPSESSTSATSFDAKCSQMTKNGTKQITEIINCEAKKINADCGETNVISYVNKSTLHLSTKTSNLFRILEPKGNITETCGIEKQYFGAFSPDLEEKVIILLGACESGKTTLVNFVANYFEDVKTPDEKMVLVNPILTNSKQSPTQAITAYSFCSEKEPGLVFTFIDTPGLNDSSGAEVREHVQTLKTFLANMNANNMKIHAIGFVAQAHLVRLTSSERLVMDYVSTLFGERVKDNIIIFITFADNKENPPIVETVQNYGFKTKHFLKFNNAILTDNVGEVEELDHVYWRKGYKSLKKGINIIKDMPPLCVNVMKALQKEVYSNTVVEGAMSDLETEIVSFVNVCKGTNRAHTNKASSYVWELARPAYFQIKKSNNCYASVEEFVREVTIDVCNKKSFNSHDCMKSLTFAPNRGMTTSAEYIIYSLYMIYSHLKTNYDNTGTTNQIKTFKKSKGTCCPAMFCHRCRQEHELECMNGRGVFGDSRYIIFKCKGCSCSGAIHGVKDETNENYNLSINKVFQHARNCIRLCIQRYSIPGVPITENELLQFIMDEISVEYKPFIEALMKNII